MAVSYKRFWKLLDVLYRICSDFDCEMNDIMEFVYDEAE